MSTILVNGLVVAEQSSTTKVSHQMFNNRQLEMLFDPPIAHRHVQWVDEI